MLGSKYVENRPIELSKTFEESSKAEPIFFILSPGLDPLTDVEALGMKGRVLWLEGPYNKRPEQKYLSLGTLSLWLSSP